MIPQKHHRFFSIGMHDVNQLFRQLTHFYLLELNKILKFLAGYPEHGIMVSFVYNEFRTEFISCPLFKFFQDIWAYAGTVAKPFHIFFPFFLIKSKGKLMKKCSKAHYIYLRIILAPFSQLLLHIFLGFRLPYIISQLMRGVLPVIGDKIIHMYRIPNQKCQKAYCILMVLHTFQFYLTGLLIIFPFFRGHYFPCCPVDNLPPTFRVIHIVHFQLFRMKAFHQLNPQPGILSRYSFAD